MKADNNYWYSFQFVTGHVMVKCGDTWRMVMLNADIIEQAWRTRVHKWGHSKPNPKKTYRMKIEGKFTLDSCTDSDCECTGCKHFCCYWADYVGLDRKIETLTH
jgi:hypothetical protein